MRVSGIKDINTAVEFSPLPMETLASGNGNMARWMAMLSSTLSSISMKVLLRMESKMGKGYWLILTGIFIKDILKMMNSMVLGNFSITMETPIVGSSAKAKERALENWLLFHQKENSTGAFSETISRKVMEFTPGTLAVFIRVSSKEIKEMDMDRSSGPITMYIEVGGKMDINMEKESFLCKEKVSWMVYSIGMFLLFLFSSKISPDKNT